MEAVGAATRRHRRARLRPRHGGGFAPPRLRLRRRGGAGRPRRSDRGAGGGDRAAHRRGLLPSRHPSRLRRGRPVPRHGGAPRRRAEFKGRARPLPEKPYRRALRRRHRRPRGSGDPVHQPHGGGRRLGAAGAGNRGGPVGAPPDRRTRQPPDPGRLAGGSGNPDPPGGEGLRPRRGGPGETRPRPAARGGPRRRPSAAPDRRRMAGRRPGGAAPGSGRQGHHLRHRASRSSPPTIWRR